MGRLDAFSIAEAMTVFSAKRSSTELRLDGVDKKMIIHKGRILGQWVDMWQWNTTILEKGIEHEADAGNHREYTLKEEEQYDIYKTMLSLAPCIIDEVQKAGQGGCIIVGTMSQPCNVCLCMSYSRFYSDLSVQDGLHDGSIVVTPSQFPCFLWHNEEVNQEQIFEGWLENELLVQGYLHIFKSPSSAIKDAGATARRGNASMHGIRTVSIPSIAYVATLIRFVLSSQSSMSRGHKAQFSYETFYNNIVRTTFEELDNVQLASLLTWWNGRIFSDVVDDNKDDEDEYSMMAMMKAQAAARSAASTAS
ncbi:hypothetical protein DEU56DRAFT_753227 [Suillus clintonianus]|uniref:uncharacterized protein n=1 Tax=Suillus clintonianus TaxID=1904413 RepID=UPI001B879535|nr:uncharacterized protein DEU56DRAFT_753227 [Suillus clintonianus]KAG2147961.1 hypothetical protein DEU56DRAFT_753227 [Suillus clintonianus]